MSFWAKENHWAAGQSPKDLEGWVGPFCWTHTVNKNVLIVLERGMESRIVLGKYNTSMAPFFSLPYFVTCVLLTWGITVKMLWSCWFKKKKKNTEREIVLLKLQSGNHSSVQPASRGQETLCTQTHTHTHRDTFSHKKKVPMGSCNLHRGRGLTVRYENPFFASQTCAHTSAQWCVRFVHDSAEHIYENTPREQPLKLYKPIIV